MVLCQVWSENRFAGLYWSSYFERGYSATTIWRYGGPGSTLMRTPDKLIFQS